MRVSMLGNTRPVFGERTNLFVQRRVKATESPRKVVGFSSDLVSTENAHTLSTKKGVILKSALRPVRRYGNKHPSNQGAKKVQRSLTERLAEQRREFEPDASILKKVVSLLESKLDNIKVAHSTALKEIEEEKKKKMKKIYQECLIEHKLAQHQTKKLDETCAHDMDVMKETIATFRENNEIMRRQNEELIAEIDELKDSNERLFEKTAFYNKAIEKAKADIADEEHNNQELNEILDFLKMRKKEYENARFEADQDIEDEQEQAVELRKKIEKVVAEIDTRCSERDFANAVSKAVSKDFARVDEENARTKCA